MEVKEQPSPSRDSQTRDIGEILRICQLNVEGISWSKCQYLSKLLSKNKIDIALLQEMHLENEEQARKRAQIPGYDIIGITYHNTYAIATYARNDIDNVKLVDTCIFENTHKIVVSVGEVHVVNIYKPPAIPWCNEILQAYPHPSIYAGDFNSHHSNWRYRETDNNGEHLLGWAEQHNLHLVFDAKERNTFKSRTWNTESNPDLAFVSTNEKCQPLPMSRCVLKEFPKSQHRPVILEMGIQIPIIKSFPKPRWNFQKADWNSFKADLDKCLGWVPPVAANYNRFVGAIISTAKKHIPRGFRKEYIPGWSEQSEQLYQDFVDSGDPEIADDLLSSLDAGRRLKWIETTTNTDFKHSSRKAWNLLKKLGASQPVTQNQSPVTADNVATRIVDLSRAPQDRQHTKIIKRELKALKQSSSELPELSGEFSVDEVCAAALSLKVGKAPGFDGVHNEFLINCGPYARQWLTKFFTDILNTSRLPNEFKRAKIIAVLKPGKPNSRADSYRPISLLSSCYKLLERLILNRIQDKLLANTPIEQAGFRPGRSCTDQVISLTTFIESGYQECLKTTAVFIDLTAAYDTVWREGLLYKFLSVIPSRKLGGLLNNMLSDRKFQVIMNGKASRQRILNNGLPQGSVIAPALFNLYIADLPATTAHKFAYADDLAIAVKFKSHDTAERILEKDLEALDSYYKKWRLVPSPNKTECSCFHLNNKQANHEPEIFWKGERLRYNPNPKYLGITLDRTLSFKKHLENTAAKIQTRNNILEKLCGTSWGATAETLRCSAMGLVFSAAEYGAPVWMSSHHVSKVDVQLNRSMRIITGCIKSTPTYWLPTLSHIMPPHIRRREALLREYKKIMDNPELPIHDYIPTACLTRLKSRHPPIKTAQALHESDFRGLQEWEAGWREVAPPDALNYVNIQKEPAGFDLPRKVWTTANRIRTGHGVCADTLYRWNKQPSHNCECGATYQTIKHIYQDCTLTAYQGPITDIYSLPPTAIEWIMNLPVSL